MVYSIISIKDIIIFESLLDGILWNDYKYSLLALSNIKIKEVIFFGNASFALSSSVISI